MLPHAFLHILNVEKVLRGAEIMRNLLYICRVSERNGRAAVARGGLRRSDAQGTPRSLIYSSINILVSVVFRTLNFCENRSLQKKKRMSRIQNFYKVSHWPSGYIYRIFDAMVLRVVTLDQYLFCVKSFYTLRLQVCTICTLEFFC